MSRRIRISFACNDPANGIFTGRVDGINVESLYQIGSTAWDASLEHRHVEGVTITVDHQRNRFRIHRVWFPFVRRIPWFGNWCWEAFEMTRPQAKQLLLLMRERRCWSCDEGPKAFYRWWNKGRGA